MKPYAFLLAGHSNWGKSHTLKAFTDGSLVRSCDVEEIPFFIRRMSNDDFNEDYRRFIDSCVKDPSKNLIAAFCPNFDIPERFSLETLERLSAHYRLHIFVLCYQYGTGQVISGPEIATMEGFGETRIYKGRDREARERAVALRDYITEVLARG